ncbi:hypothetical protein [Streptomyces olivaceoviridis]|uniref:hypothetical protein n=1 Tax=Streptomyces olivaceoviridis TaxID=1921 RepID=UPI003700920A
MNTDHPGEPDLMARTDPVLPGDDPTEAHYATDTKANLGEPLPLPAPFPTLDTSPFTEG